MGNKDVCEGKDSGKEILVRISISADLAQNLLTKFLVKILCWENPWQGLGPGRMKENANRQLNEGSV